MHTLRLSYKQIHGCINEKNVIIGYNGYKKIEEMYAMIKKSSSDIFASYADLLIDCDELYILGHSLGESDEKMFKPFFEWQVSKDAQRKKIVISYYQQSGKDALEQRIKRLTGSTLGTILLSKYNDVQFINTKVEDEKKSFLKKYIRPVVTIIAISLIGKGRISF